MISSRAGQAVLIVLMGITLLLLLLGVIFGGFSKDRAAKRGTLDDARAFTASLEMYPSQASR